MKYVIHLTCQDREWLQQAIQELAEVLASEPVDLGLPIELPLFDDDGSDNFTTARFIIQEA